MHRLKNPLDNIKIASPCGTDWNEMRGNERRRYCAECKLNVYNLAEMSREEAENFLINSEGRVCLRLYRRADGTVITKDCPVGWAGVKRKASRAAAAVFALVAGFFGGMVAYTSVSSLNRSVEQKELPAASIDPEGELISFGGMVDNLPRIKLEILKNR